MCPQVQLKIPTSSNFFLALVLLGWFLPAKGLLSQENPFRATHPLGSSARQCGHINTITGDHWAGKSGAGHSAQYAGKGIDLHYARCTWHLAPGVRYIRGEVCHHFTTTSAVNELSFDFSDTLQVDSITFRGQVRSYWQDSTQQWLIVSLDTPLPAGTRDSVCIAYQGAPRRTGVGSFTADTLPDHGPLTWTVSQPYGSRDWWPTKITLNDKIDSIDIFLVHPDSSRASSNGLRLAEAPLENNRTRTHYRHNYPIPAYLVAIAVADYHRMDTLVASVTGAEVLWEEHTFPAVAHEHRQMRNRLIDVFHYFESLFGPYPYAEEKYGQTLISWGGGMEHATNSFVGTISIELWVHELAHMWFGNKVTCGTWRDLWLNEGLASLLTGMYYERFSPELYWPQWKRLVRENMVVARPTGSVLASDSTSGFEALFDTPLRYFKPAKVLLELRWELGDSVFYAGLRDFLTRPGLAWNYAYTPDLRQRMEDACRCDLNPFFQRWIYGEGFPTYTLRQRETPNDLQVYVRQRTSHPSVSFFPQKVEYKLWGKTTGGQQWDSTFIYWHRQPEQLFKVDLPANVNLDSLRLDPNDRLVRGSTEYEAWEAIQPDVLLYPNPLPTGETLTLRWGAPEWEPVSYRLLSPNGQVLESGGLEACIAPECRINLKTAYRGLVIVELQSADGQREYRRIVFE